MRWEGEKERKKSLLNPASKIGETVRKCENHYFPSKMADFSSDEDPLPSLEDFLVDRVDDLEVSIGELSIDGKCLNRWYFWSAHGLLHCSSGVVKAVFLLCTLRTRNPN